MLERFHLAIAIVTVVASSIFLLALMLMLVDERRTTVGILRLIGFRRRRILLYVLAEGAVIAATGAAFGIVISAAFQGGINRFFQWRYDTALVFVRITPAIALRSIAMAVPLGVAAAVAASWTLAAARGVLVDASMRALAFAVRSLVRQPGRAGVGILGIAAVGALLFDMLLLSRGLVVSFRTLLDSVGFDVRVMATEPGPVGGPRLAHAAEIARALAALPEVDEAVPIRLVDAEATARGRAIRFSLMAVDVRARRPWTLTAGSDLDAAAPGGPPPMLVNRRLAAALAVSPGDAIAVRVTCSIDRAAPLPVRFSIRGIADFPFDDVAQMTAATGSEAAARACGDEAGSEADMVLVASREGFGPDAAVQAIRRARPDLHPATNEEIVARMQEQGFTYFRQISAVLSTITMLFGLGAVRKGRKKS